MTYVIHADEGITQYEYDEQGLIDAVTDENGVKYLKNSYDERRALKKSPPKFRLKIINRKNIEGNIIKFLFCLDL